MSGEIPEDPGVFFRDVFPGRWAAVARGVERSLGSMVIDTSAVAGEAAWAVWIEAGQIRTAPGGRDDTMLQITTVRGSWRDTMRVLLCAAVGRDGAAGYCGIGCTLKSETLQDVFRVVRGTAHVAMPDAGHVIALTFGGVEPTPDEPRAVIEIAAEDAPALGRGEIQELFVAGRIQPRGDMAMVLQIGGLAVESFARLR